MDCHAAAEPHDCPAQGLPPLSACPANTKACVGCSLTFSAALRAHLYVDQGILQDWAAHLHHSVMSCSDIACIMDDKLARCTAAAAFMQSTRLQPLSCITLGLPEVTLAAAPQAVNACLEKSWLWVSQLQLQLQPQALQQGASSASPLAQQISARKILGQRIACNK